MRKRLLSLSVLACLVTCVAAAQPRVRQPIGAGVWYPENAEALESTILTYFAEADVTPLEGMQVAALAPHGAYKVAGEAAASAFRQLTPNYFHRVIVLTSWHYGTFRGCSIPAVAAYRTPLGDVPLDGPAIRRLCRSPLIDERAVLYSRKSRTRERMNVHEEEHAIEAVLPFLQVRLGDFRLVPIVVGSLHDRRGEWSESNLNSVARVLKEITDDRTLLVVSTNMTHYGPQYGFVPFDNQRDERILRLDLDAVRLIGSRSYDDFRRYLRTTGNPIDGVEPIALLMKALEPQVSGALHGHATSALQVETEGTSVSYVGMGFYDPRRSVPNSASAPRERPAATPPATEGR